MRKAMIAVALTMGALAFTGTAMAATVTPASLAPGGHWYKSDTRGTGTGTFENGPGTPPAGIGSFELNTPDPTAKVQLFTDLYNGTKLAGIDGIGYSTYRTAAPLNSPALAALNIRVDTDNNGTPDAYLVYEPYQDLGNAAIQDNTWQNWDAYRGGAAKWWFNTGGGIGCDQGHPCTWSSIVTALPNATVREGTSCGPGGVVTPCPGSLGVNQGSGNPGVVSNADALYVSVNHTSTTYDFELYEVATDKDQCKKDGWKSVKRANGSSFKNQGDCIQYANTGK